MRALSAIITIITLTHAQGFNLFGFHRNVLLRNIKYSQSNISTFSDEDIEQLFDNFNKSETRTWKNRYYKKLDLWKPGGPIIIKIGGESDCSGEILEDPSSLHYQLAKETNGALYATEHRYYCASQLKLDPVDFRFFSSQQALADIAQLIRFIKSDPKLKASRVVVVGGSYAGSLAAWMRLRYPHLVDAAVSSSGPVLAKKDFYEYVDVVHHVLDQYGPGCIQYINETVERFTEMLKTSKGREDLRKNLTICQRNDMNVKENQQMLFFIFFGHFYTKVTYGTPDQIREHCETNEFSLLESFKQHSDHFWNMTDDEICLDIDYEAFANSLQYFPWVYQTCTEFGFYQTTNSEKRPFVHWNPLDFYINLCTKVYGEQFNENRVDAGVANTNKVYGGNTPNVTRVVFVHGAMDPWHPLGVVRDLSDEAPARVVEGTSHCAVLRETPEDPKQLTDVRNFVKTLIKKWIAVSDINDYDYE